MENTEKSLATLEELINFLETQPVFDKLADAGCGYVDPHRSDVFDQLLQRARDSIEELKKLLASNRT